MFYEFSSRHQTAAGLILAVLMVLAFGIVGGIEQGTIPLPF